MESKPELISYYLLRALVGLIGIALPFALIASTRLEAINFEPSISEFFYTDARELMVAALCAIGVFLIAYRGHSPVDGEWVSDNVLSTLAGISAIGVAFFPTGGEKTAQMVTDRVTLTQELLGIGTTSTLHVTFAGLFFLLLAGICWFKFAQTHSAPRRLFYQACALVLVAVLLALAYLFLSGTSATEEGRAARYVFWVEAIGTWVFGGAWLLKGIPKKGSLRAA